MSDSLRYSRLKESTELLQELLDDELVPEEMRPAVAVQIVYNEEALMPEKKP